MSRIDLVYFADCPNVETARDNLRAAIGAAGLDTTWTEWDLSAEDVPLALLGYGSPAVLVGGRSVRGERRGDAVLSCSTGGAPETAQILRALRWPDAPGRWLGPDVPASERMA